MRDARWTTSGATPPAPGWSTGWTAELEHRYRRVIERLLAEPERHFGHPDAPTLTAVEVIERPYSKIVKCRAHSRRGGVGLYVKLFHPGWTGSDRAYVLRKIETEVEVLDRLRGRFQESRGPGVPVIVGFFPDELAVVTQEIRGRQLLDLVVKEGQGFRLPRAIDALKNQLRAVGRWLREFQAVTRTNGLGRATGPAFMEYVEVRLQKLAGLAIDVGQPELNAIRSQLTSLLHEALFEDDVVCGVHGDLGLSNVLVADRHVAVLDFSMYRIGSRYNDPAYLYTRLESLLDKPLVRRATVLGLQRAFLEGYQRPLDDRHPLFIAYYVRHKLNRLVDLAKADEASAVRRLFQRRQFRTCLRDVQRCLGAVEAER